MQPSSQQFLDLASQSGVVAHDELAGALDRLGLNAEKVATLNVHTLAGLLVSAQTMTPWQAERLLQGRHQGFQLGSYRLLSVLGRGSMGTVYLAEHSMMRRRCALKVLLFHHADEPCYLARFTREVQAVASLDHPNIVGAYDAGMVTEGKRDIYFLAMEFIDGRNVSELIRESGPLNPARAARFARQVAEGLDYAHGAGLIHRDIKPGNLMVDRRDVVRILDLGLAAFHDDEHPLLTAQNELPLGTADYMSPEQILDCHNIDERADIYSLGCTLYFMLTGQPPFQHGNLLQRLVAHRNTEPASIRELRPEVPAGLCEIVERMMHKSVGKRFASCEEVRTVLTEWLTASTDGASNATHSAFVAAERSPAPPVISPEEDSWSIKSAETMVDLPVFNPEAETDGSYPPPAVQPPPPDRRSSHNLPANESETESETVPPTDCHSSKFAITAIKFRRAIWTVWKRLTSLLQR